MHDGMGDCEIKIAGYFITRCGHLWLSIEVRRVILMCKLISLRVMLVVFPVNNDYTSIFTRDYVFM